MKLRTKIVVSYTLAMILILIIFAAIIERTSTNTAIEKAYSSSSRELGLIVNNVETLVDSYEDYSRLIASDVQLQGEIRQSTLKKENVSDASYEIEALATYSRYSKIIRNIITPNTKAKAICIFTPVELIYSGYGLDHDSVSEILDMDFIEEAMVYQKPLWRGPDEFEFTQGNKEIMFSVAKLIMDKETGEKIGVAVLLFDETSISSIYDDVKQNVKDEFYVVNNQHEIISAHDKTIIGTNILGALDISNEAMEEIEVNGSYISNDESFEVLYSMSEFGQLNWSIISRITLYELAEERRQVMKVIVLMVAISSAFFIIIAVFIASTVSKPISRLSRLMNDIIDRDIKLRARTDETGEIGVLANGFNTMMDEIEVLIEQVYREQELKRKSELALSQEQIKPHFLYNAIGTIESLINLDKKYEAKEMAQQLASFYRLSLSNGEDIITIEEELDLTKNYLKIQGFRYVEFFNYTIDIDPDIYKYKIPKLTLQPIVENAIYHGIKEKGSLGHIEIRSEIHDTHLTLCVFDDGCGMSNEQIDQCLTQNSNDKGFGVHSVDQRLKLYYGETCGITINSEVGLYTEVAISIPKER